MNRPLSASEREFLATGTLILEAMHRNARRRVFQSLYPDEDQALPDGTIAYSRHKYPKHMEFFEAGAEYRERCAMAANRCVSPWTYLETPAGEVLSADRWTSADPTVFSLAGGSRCVARSESGLLLGIEQGFRIVLGSGRFFDCSRRHRVLTTEGWLEIDQLVSRASGLRCWHRREDYQANCDAGGYLGGQPLLQVAGIDLELPRQRVGAQRRAPFLFELPDEVAPILRRIRVYPQPDRLATRGDLHRFAALFGLFSGPSSAQSCLSLSDRTLADLPLLAASASLPREAGGLPLDQSSSDAPLVLEQRQILAEPCRSTAWSGSRQYGWQWCDTQAPGGAVQEWFRDAAHMPIFYPTEHPSLVGGERIVAIVPLGLQPIIDAHVPPHNNYLAAGVCHHNTGKSFGMGGYETVAHLTGLYPEWWPGRKFKKPIKAWAAGKTNETTRDIVQLILMGEPQMQGGRRMFDGTGLIPGNLIGSHTFKAGLPDLIDTVKIRHVSGGWSQLGFKSYQQGRGAFEGTERHVIWLDEEPPADVYGECLIRTATVNGLVLLTFTPLEGLSEVVLSFLPQEMRPDAPNPEEETS